MKTINRSIDRTDVQRIGCKQRSLKNILTAATFERISDNYRSHQIHERALRLKKLKLKRKNGAKIERSIVSNRKKRL